MKLPMYAIKDELNGFTSPIPFMKEELARRYLKDQFMSNPTIKNTPEDFSIYYIGEYDTETGDFKSEVIKIEGARSYGNE